MLGIPLGIAEIEKIMGYAILHNPLILLMAFPRGFECARGAQALVADVKTLSLEVRNNLLRRLLMPFRVA